MLVGAVYNTLSGMVMSLAFSETPAEDANLNAGQLPLGGKAPAGKSLAVLSVPSVHASLADIIAAAQKQLGLALIAPPRCAIIDPVQNLVVDVALADPANHPFGNRPVFACAADIGWTYNALAQSLTSPPSIDPKTLQPVAATVISVAAVVVAPP